MASENLGTRPRKGEASNVLILLDPNDTCRNSVLEFYSESLRNPHHELYIIVYPKVESLKYADVQSNEASLRHQFQKRDQEVEEQHQPTKIAYEAYLMEKGWKGTVRVSAMSDHEILTDTISRLADENLASMVLIGTPANRKYACDCTFIAQNSQTNCSVIVIKTEEPAQAEDLPDAPSSPSSNEDVEGDSKYAAILC